MGAMFDYRAELERRIAQFLGYLKLMYHRAHEIAEGPCFIIFEERRPRGSSDASLVETRELALQAVQSAFAEFEFTGDPGDSATHDLPDEGWRGDDSQNRYVQFSFEKNWFCSDMPFETLFRPEAEQILRSRKGFFYLADRPQFTLKGEDVEGHDPFRKIYIYGDEQSAAEDMAFVFFQVWKFPVESRFYVTSAAFSGKHRWEQGVPIE
jgi:hypothetical protein